MKEKKFPVKFTEKYRILISLRKLLKILILNIKNIKYRMLCAMFMSMYLTESSGSFEVLQLTDFYVAIFNRLTFI